VATESQTIDILGLRAQGLFSVLSDPVLIKAIAHIESDYGARLTLSAVARAAGLSPFHFHRRFRDKMGETVAEYVRRVRLEHAATHVCRTSSPLIDITFRLGYGSQEAFSRAYVQRFGVTPGRMRSASQDTLQRPSRRDLDWAELVRPERLAALPLIGMRFVGVPRDAGDPWKKFAAVLRESGFSLEQARAVGIHYDDPGFVPPEAIRYDCCIIDPRASALPLRPPLRELQTRSGLYASLTRKGGTTITVESITSVVVGWLPASRYGLGDTLAYEFHHTPPWESEARSTTVWIPIL
jgi:AraC family transcriptional regulator